ncbi:CubicO group peptidase (beta-lactamase class C family) [Chitinivorax tropicus]|uniref:CubicO group peptidase (Beta-lactamase class C family) n=1 Tax=Chitinivorax tropicus TaxID=714531 RepID=A0A840MU43_9PROT|nr:serine hydrolase domain-containing protein [Chitinivorax tropicus]MBB5019833.1 CubicO group peptidase (beta-lactamase class C family) [Chitinivorax tropicus]
MSMATIIGWAALVLAILAGIALSFVYHKLTYVEDTRPLQDQIQSEAEKLHTNAKVSDVVIAVAKGEHTWMQTLGRQNASADTYQIGSVTKVFTATLAQRLVDQGILKWEQTLGDLPGKQMMLAPEVKRITLRQLATHTAGFPSVPKSLEDEVIRLVGQEQIMLDPYNHLSTDAVWAYLAKPEGIRAPGTFEYSNYGMGLLAHVMELVTDTTYPELLHREVLAPLGMAHTHADLPDAVSRALVQGYDTDGKPCAPWRFKSLTGAGSMTSTAHDLLRFGRAHFDPQSPLASTLARTREIQNGNTAIGWMRPVWIDRLLGNRDILWHNGLVAGYGAYISIDRAREQVVVVLTSKGVDPALVGARLTKIARET